MSEPKGGSTEPPEPPEPPLDPPQDIYTSEISKSTRAYTGGLNFRRHLGNSQSRTGYNLLFVRWQKK